MLAAPLILSSVFTLRLPGCTVVAALDGELWMWWAVLRLNLIWLNLASVLLAHSPCRSDPSKRSLRICSTCQAGGNHTCEWHANKSALHQHIGERSLLQAISRTLPDSWSVCKVVHQCWPNLIKINNRTDNFSKHPTSQRRRVRPEEQLPISLPLAGRLEEPTCWALNWKIWSRNSGLELKF